MSEKRNLYIIGAGDFGRVMEYWLDLIPESERDWRLAGFLHSYEGKSPLEDYPTSLSIAGDWQDFGFRDSDLCIMGISNPSWKRRVHERLKDKVEFMTFIHPAASLNRRFLQIGAGAVICPHCVLSTNVRAGACVTICIGTQIGHDVVLGDYSSLMGNVEIGGHAKIGEGAYVGSNATIIPHKSICPGAYIGAGSVVVRNVKDTTTRFGNPARPLSVREMGEMG